MIDVIEKLNLTIPELREIRRVVKKMNIDDGAWSIRHLEGMQAVIQEEILRRYSQKVIPSGNGDTK